MILHGASASSQASPQKVIGTNKHQINNILLEDGIPENIIFHENKAYAIQKRPVSNLEGIKEFDLGKKRIIEIVCK